MNLSPLIKSFLILTFLSYISCQGKIEKRGERCLRQKILSDSKSKEGVETLNQFKDTLSSWKNLVGIKRYNFIVDGLIFSEDKTKGVLFLILQRNSVNTGFDRMKLIIYKKDGKKINFYHRGSMSLSFSRSDEVKAEKPIPLDSLQMFYRNSLLNNYKIIRKYDCSLSKDFIETWIDNDYHHKKHMKWLRNPERF